MGSFADRLRANARAAPPKHVVEALAARTGRPQGPRRIARAIVGGSSDLERILALPTRVLDLKTRPDWAFLESLKKVNHNCRCKALRGYCALELQPVQAHALHEAASIGGLVGAIGVGHGKELICELLALAVPDVRTAVLLIPPDMREAFARDWEYYGQHWKQPNLAGGKAFLPGRPRLCVIAYSELSHEKFTAALDKLAPDLIIANEGHKLCGLDAVRTSRMLTHCANRPGCRLVVVSGTLPKRSIRDYAHLFTLALGGMSPVPDDPAALEEWSLAIDPQKNGKLPAMAGALHRLCRPGETLRAAYQRRVWVESAGVIATVDASCNASISIHERKVEVPLEVRAALAATRAGASRPDGQEAEQASEVHAWLKEIASGFYYRSIYPRGEARELIERWRKARCAFSREIRLLLEHPRPYLDSPALAVKAAIRHHCGHRTAPDRPAWPSRAWPEWRDIRKEVVPEQATVWLHDFLAQDAARWAQEKPGIVWYTSTAFGQRVAELSGCKLYDGGARNNHEIENETGRCSIIASSRANGEGKNLQMFNRNLVAEPPHDAALWEQLIGRTHRQRQLADEITVFIYRHTPEVRLAFEHAEELALWAQETSRNRTKLCFASRDW